MELFDLPINATVISACFLSKLITSRVAEARVLNSASRWYGVTYREDRSRVLEAVGRMVEEGSYPSPLWKHKI